MDIFWNNTVVTRTLLLTFHKHRNSTIRWETEEKGIRKIGYRIPGGLLDPKKKSFRPWPKKNRRHLPDSVALSTIKRERSFLLYGNAMLWKNKQIWIFSGTTQS